MPKKYKVGVIAIIVEIFIIFMSLKIIRKNKIIYNKSTRPKLFRKIGFYEKYIKRIIDIVCSILAVIVFGWLYVIIAVLVKVKLGSPILFAQYRPGIIDLKTGKEKIFKMYKFRTMTDERDSDGNLLPDNLRLTKFGKWLRSTSLDELPEIISIIKGDMSLIGPRPQLVKDMVFMSRKQRLRHTARPGLSGLAQVMGRNAISWDKKLDYDLYYISHVSFINDFKILLKTVEKAFFKREGITEEGNVTASDYGDYLLLNNRIIKEEYDKGQTKARKILEKVI
jgi:capsular polysaccharide biosynthesis protein cps4E